MCYFVSTALVDSLGPTSCHFWPTKYIFLIRRPALRPSLLEGSSRVDPPPRCPPNQGEDLRAGHAAHRALGWDFPRTRRGTYLSGHRSCAAGRVPPRLVKLVLLIGRHLAPTKAPAHSSARGL